MRVRAKGRATDEYFYSSRLGDSVVIDQALRLIGILLTEQFQGRGVMGIIGEFLFVIQQPLQLFREMTHFAVVVIRQGLEELLLILLNVLVNRFHDLVRHLADIGLLAKTTHFDQSVDLPLWSKAHNRSSQEPITSCDIAVAICRSAKESQEG